MNNKYYVYFHINPIKNEIFYIGKGYGPRYKKRNRNVLWKRTVEKYGEPIIVKIKENISNKYAIFLEKAYIKLIGRKDLGLGPLVNLTDGGEGSIGYKHTEESKNKMKENHYNCSGENNSFYGKKHSDKTKDSIRKTLTGKKLSEEHKKRISEGVKKNKSLKYVNN